MWYVGSREQHPERLQCCFTYLEVVMGGLRMVYNTNNEQHMEVLVVEPCILDPWILDFWAR